MKNIVRVDSKKDHVIREIYDFFPKNYYRIVLPITGSNYPFNFLNEKKDVYSIWLNDPNYEFYNFWIHVRDVPLLLFENIERIKNGIKTREGIEKLKKEIVINYSYKNDLNKASYFYILQKIHSINVNIDEKIKTAHIETFLNNKKLYYDFLEWSKSLVNINFTNESLLNMFNFCDKDDFMYNSFSESFFNSNGYFSKKNTINKYILKDYIQELRFKYIFVFDYEKKNEIMYDFCNVYTKEFIVSTRGRNSKTFLYKKNIVTNIDII